MVSVPLVTSQSADFSFLFVSFLFSDMGTNQIRKMTDFSRCRKKTNVCIIR